MNLTFYEVSVFARVRDDLLGGDEGYRALQNVLLDNPRMGEVIPGTNGVRKMRVGAAGRGKGKRGGLRVIYLYIGRTRHSGFLCSLCQKCCCGFDAAAKASDCRRRATRERQADMNEPTKFQAVPDEHIAEEGTVSADELFNDIMAGFAELQAFEEGDTACFSEQPIARNGKTLRVTEYVDGKRLLPADITAAELKARRLERGIKTKSSRNGSSHNVAEEIPNEEAVAGESGVCR